MIALRLYQIFTFLMAPLVHLALIRRVAQGREDKARLRERFGRASIKRPHGHLVWVHAVSVGETNSVLPLIEDILTTRPAQNVLLTTTTVASASVVARYQSAHPDFRGRLKHQFNAFDRAAYVAAFLTHWQPDAAFQVESELWPNTITACAQRKIPLIMVNGRLSPHSVKRWQKIPSAIRYLLNKFSILIAQDTTTAALLEALGLKNIKTLGNLKLDAPPLNVDEAALSELQETLADRPRFVAASTHIGEEIQIGEAHRMIKDTQPNMLTLIAPRHPERGDKLAAELRSAGFALAQRSRGEMPDADTDIYLLDTLGELGLFYRLSDIVFMGGSLVPHGGHNPIEAARLECTILHGPHVENFQEIFDALSACKAVTPISDAATLAAQIKAFIQAPASAKQIAEAAKTYAHQENGARARTLDALTPYLCDPSADPVAPQAYEAHDG